MKLHLSIDQLPARLHLESPMTDAEFLLFCEQSDGWSVEREPNGDLLLMSPAGTPTSRINARILRLLANWAVLDGRGETTGPDGGYTLRDGSVRMPDAAWYSLDRFARLPEERQRGFAHICPEFVIELRSETDRLPDVLNKMQVWMENGAELAWLIDPAQRKVSVYRPDSSVEEYEDPTSIPGTGPVSGFELVLADVWGAAGR